MHFITKYASTLLIWLWKMLSVLREFPRSNKPSDNDSLNPSMHYASLTLGTSKCMRAMLGNRRTPKIQTTAGEQPHYQLSQKMITEDGHSPSSSPQDYMYSSAYSPTYSVANGLLGHNATGHDTLTTPHGARSFGIATNSARTPKPALSSSALPSSCTTRRCWRCNRTTKREIVKQGNRKGHDGRPYYRCQPCDKFHSWGDNQGVYVSNPTCDCDNPSRREKTTKKGRVKEYYECATRRCTFYRVVSSKPYYRHKKRIVEARIQQPNDSLQINQVSIRRNGYCPS